MTAILAAPTVSLVKERTALYRFFGADDVLLYIGISRDFLKRRAQHASRADWWPRVVRHSVEYRSSRSLALRDEARAIRTERPLFNCAEVPDELLPSGLRPAHRPVWVPETEAQARALEAVVLAERERTEARALLSEALAAAHRLDVPIAHLAQRAGRTRATVYRHLSAAEGSDR